MKQPVNGIGHALSGRPRSAWTRDRNLHQKQNGASASRSGGSSTEMTLEAFEVVAICRGAVKAGLGLTTMTAWPLFETRVGGKGGFG